MYQFNKIKTDDGAWKFELDNIKLFIDGFKIADDKHWIKTPVSAIAFFTMNNNVYSVSNELNAYKTVEEFYDAMLDQYAFFNPPSSLKKAS